VTPASSEPIRLIVGLGNPGPRYAGTRHNAGFLVLDALAHRWGVRFTKAKQAEEARHATLHLLKPLTYMNLSGAAVQGLISRERIAPESMLVIHDDIDLPLGRLRYKRGGGAGGQRGVQDVKERIGANFERLKIGVSRPPEGWQVEDWVLSRFANDETTLLEGVVAHAVQAVEQRLAIGFERAAAWTNALDLRSAQPT
jgi:peptidyl-tRNA hydrolase, PTH1 family